MRYFKSIEELKAADPATLTQVPGITPNVAKNIHDFFETKEKTID
jgi:ERCC4-type nuclease